MELHKAEKLAKDLMKKYDCPYEFKFNDALTSAGRCDYIKMTIFLSKNYCELNSEEEVKDTILHEIAHYLAPTEGHSHKWKAVAKKIGCSASVYTTESVKTVPKKYRLVCSNCGKHALRYRKSTTKVCGFCCKKFNKGKPTLKYLLKCEPIPPEQQKE